jgi:uridine kinase
MRRFVLISGVPRAGKSSFADAIVERQPGFTHVSLDRYIRPLPEGVSFVQWVKNPSCIEWDRLRAHIGILESGSVCFTPQQDWKHQRGKWISDGGAIADGPGRRMEPAGLAYLIVGTHAFEFPADGAGNPMRVFVDTPDDVIAARFAGAAVSQENVAGVLHTYLSDNARRILAQKPHADLIIDGTTSRDDQVARFSATYAHHVRASVHP